MGLTLPPDDPDNPKRKKSNLADGRTSYDSESTGNLVEFFNRNVTPYPTDVGAPAFDLIPVEKQKDIMVNVARMHGHQEYVVSWNWLRCYSDKPTKSDSVWKLPIWCMLQNIRSKFTTDSATGWLVIWPVAEPC
jgi:hypothetical protein